MPSMKHRNSLDQSQASAHSPLRVILMRSRVPKVREHPIAHILRDKSTGLGDLLCAAAVIRADDLAHVLGVEARRECGRTHKVAKHDRELSAFSRTNRRRLRGGGLRRWPDNFVNAVHGQFVTAFRAELCTRRMRNTARRTTSQKSRTALRAEFAALGNIALATQTLHGSGPNLRNRS